MTTAVISAVIPAFNAAPFLGAAIASIRRQARPVEIVVVDDASTDGTGDLARAEGADRVITLVSNVGPGAARNRGVAEVAGDIIGFLDADDLWTDGRLDKMLAALTGATDVVVGATRVVSSADDGVAVVPKLCSMVARRGALDRVGPFDEALRSYEDYDWFLRAGELGVRLVTIPAVVTEYRRRPESLSQANPPQPSAMLQLLQRSLDRRRALEVGSLTAVPWGVRSP